VSAFFAVFTFPFFVWWLLWRK
jgi:hypothetical protein